MHKLPNKNHVDTEGAVTAMLDGSASNVYFLDIEKGVVLCFISDDETDDLESIRKQPDRYFKVPRVPELTKEKWMREFLKEFVVYEDVPFAEKLLSLEGDTFYVNALFEIGTSEDGWIHGWVQWSRDHAYELLDEWFATLPIEIIDEWEGCEDCAICRAMSSGEDSREGLSKAFSEQDFMNKVEEVLKPKKLL